jgi:hypothetical protein
MAWWISCNCWSRRVQARYDSFVQLINGMSGPKEGEGDADTNPFRRLEINSTAIFPAVSALFGEPAADFTSRQQEGNIQWSIDYRYSSAWCVRKRSRAGPPQVGREYPLYLQPCIFFFTCTRWIQINWCWTGILNYVKFLLILYASLFSKKFKRFLFCKRGTLISRAKFLTTFL